MKNRLSDLNNHLFAQMERLGEEGLTAEQVEQEAKRTDAMVAVADKIIENAKIQLGAVKLLADHGDRFKTALHPMLGTAPGAGAPAIEDQTA